MTTDPPAAARSLISVLTPHRTRDSIIGDLLEEYHASQVPAHGRRAADLWFWRQAFGFVVHSSMAPGLAVAAILTTRTLVDVAAPAADLSARAWVTTVSSMFVFAWSGLLLGRSTGRTAGAVVLALTSSVIATIVGAAAALTAMGIAAAAASPSPAAWNALREGLDIPLPAIAVIGTALASLGAALGSARHSIPYP